LVAILLTANLLCVEVEVDDGWVCVLSSWLLVWMRTLIN